MCWPTNMGWMMGPWLLYAALLNSAAVAIFQGSPLSREFGVFVERARVSMLGLVPSIYKVAVGGWVGRWGHCERTVGAQYWEEQEGGAQCWMGWHFI